VIAGAVGRGKSSLAVAWLVESGGSSPAYVHANRLASIDRGSYAGASVERTWRGFSALVIDDLGAENLDTQAARGFLGLLEEILDTAAMSGRAVLVTTNVKRADIAPRYGKRLESRICGAGLWLKLEGVDLRVAGAESIADTGRQR
jgi:DNA replication protein DnaC